MNAILHHIEKFDGTIGLKPYSGPIEMFFCPGCQCGHWFATGPGTWSFNGNREKPTVHPSIVQTTGKRCHLFVADGKLVFCSDSEHKYAGQTVPMEIF